jgi:periplasmic protein TonB
MRPKQVNRPLLFYACLLPLSVSLPAKKRLMRQQRLKRLPTKPKHRHQCQQASCKTLLNISADVTKWLDQAGTKSAERLAAEEKKARELKLAQEKVAQETKAAQDAKAAALLAAKARDTAKAAPPPPQVVAPKPVEIPVVAPTVTKAAPATATAAPEPVVLKLLSSVQPKFPIAAAREGLTQGTVTARMFIDTNGSISKVEIVNAQPKKFFDKEVIAAGLQWKYAPVNSPQVNVVQFNFKLDG